MKTSKLYTLYLSDTYHKRINWLPVYTLESQSDLDGKGDLRPSDETTRKSLGGNLRLKQNGWEECGGGETPANQSPVLFFIGLFWMTFEERMCVQIDV